MENQKVYPFTCPDCGNIGLVPSKPRLISEEVPEKKSVNKNFTCERCGEGIMVWAEGADLATGLRVYSCPYCGTQDSMHLT